MTSSSPNPDTATPPDWTRLQQALAVEADRGFNNLQGKQYRFHEFLSLSLHQIPADVPTGDYDRWQRLAQRFREYPDLSYGDRRHLVAETRQTLHRTRLSYEAPPEPSPTKAVPTAPRTAPLIAPTHHTAIIPHLDLPLSKLNGVGPRSAQNLAKLNLLTVQDLLYYYPRDYIDYARQVNIRDLEEGSTVTVVGSVKRFNCFTSPKNKKLTIFELVLRDRSGEVKLSRFFAGTRYSNRGWQESQKRIYAPGTTVAASGLVKLSTYGPSCKTLQDPELEVLDRSNSPIESLNIGRVLPVYSLTEGVGSDTLRRSVIAALPATQQLTDPLPPSLREQYDLLPLPQAISQIHFPDDGDQLALARCRLVFDEFFYLQLGMLRRRQRQRQEQTQIQLAPTGELLDRFYQLLPFALTQAQQRVIKDILNDLQQPSPMNRLVQGDVGSGKTVVAVVALVAAIQAGYQGALMAPTEVLAEQHYRKLVDWFTLLHLPVELLTGSTKAAKRRTIHNQLATGELPLLVGTHALIQEAVTFNRLGLAVIDEQHRFGVQQRALLQQKGNNPHVLTMTATPIPRTLALTLHGDLEVSQIDELPPGRQAIQTTVLQGRDRPHAYTLIRREVAQGRQVYVVLPLVEESEKLDLKSAIEEQAHLQTKIFPEFTVGLLHGRMTSAEKDRAITAFRDGETAILVSTTVVEVGVDVPNATVMLIEEADRFGLAQLHQLRGRVGRGAAQSYCLLINNKKGDIASQRLKVMEQSQDGFFISEMDMRFRGPGEVLGTRQSGLPDFALASLVNDQDVLYMARQAAEDLMAQDPQLQDWPDLRETLAYRYQRLMGGSILT
ncbi:ATP-dependent DNA helicase RecG [Prochlorothrix hollandica]|uniref:ATP-dependent DNA helicase RecG n=1 Tax=Prochlorothrix hollandica PCC 9006 = CALU 1027 TaxID=317619 RepID=A0A0M2PYS0_PROHO|nr:ATP-dependent DNA helicase RecG [Prochlorothrix hollandica PCC 9006 = CALU 1027]